MGSMADKSEALSLTMLLENLRDQCEALREAEAHTRAVRAERDRMVRDLLDGGMPKSRVSRVAKLSRSVLYKIQIDGRSPEDIAADVIADTGPKY